MIAYDSTHKCDYCGKGFDELEARYELIQYKTFKYPDGLFEAADEHNNGAIRDPGSDPCRCNYHNRSHDSNSCYPHYHIANINMDNRVMWTSKQTEPLKVHHHHFHPFEFHEGCLREFIGSKVEKLRTINTSKTTTCSLTFTLNKHIVKVVTFRIRPFTNDDSIMVALLMHDAIEHNREHCMNNYQPYCDDRMAHKMGFKPRNRRSSYVAPYGEPFIQIPYDDNRPHPTKDMVDYYNGKREAGRPGTLKMIDDECIYYTFTSLDEFVDNVVDIIIDNFYTPVYKLGFNMSGAETYFAYYTCYAIKESNELIGLTNGIIPCGADSRVPIGTKIKVHGTGDDNDIAVYTVTHHIDKINSNELIYDFSLGFTNVEKVLTWGPKMGNVTIYWNSIENNIESDDGCDCFCTCDTEEEHVHCEHHHHHHHYYPCEKPDVEEDTPDEFLGACGKRCVYMSDSDKYYDCGNCYHNPAFKEEDKPSEPGTNPDNNCECSCAEEELVVSRTEPTNVPAGCVWYEVINQSYDDESIKPDDKPNEDKPSTGGSCSCGCDCEDKDEVVLSETEPTTSGVGDFWFQVISSDE